MWLVSAVTSKFLPKSLEENFCDIFYDTTKNFMKIIDTTSYTFHTFFLCFFCWFEQVNVSWVRKSSCVLCAYHFFPFWKMRWHAIRPCIRIIFDNVHVLSYFFIDKLAWFSIFRSNIVRKFPTADKWLKPAR